MQSAYAVNTCSVLDGGGLEGDWPIVGAARLGDEENSGNLFSSNDPLSNGFTYSSPPTRLQIISTSQWVPDELSLLREVAD